MNTCSAKRLDARRILAKRLRTGYLTLTVARPCRIFTRFPFLSLFSKSDKPKYFRLKKNITKNLTNILVKAK